MTWLGGLRSLHQDASGWLGCADSGRSRVPDRTAGFDPLPPSFPSTATTAHAPKVPPGATHGIAGQMKSDDQDHIRGGLTCRPPLVSRLTRGEIRDMASVLGDRGARWARSGGTGAKWRQR
jgi:hypothetical protein